MLTCGIPPEFRGGVHLFILKPPYAIGSVPSLSGHAITNRWRSLPRVRRHRPSKPQGSSERVLPWQVIMDQLICASLSHTHYCYEVGMLKVPAYTKLMISLLDVITIHSVYTLPNWNTSLTIISTASTVVTLIQRRTCACASC